jgi:hypothetical protein
MKAFRGTLVAALAVVVLGGAWWALQPAQGPNLTPAQRKSEAAAAALFPFEKADLVKVEVVRPDGTLVLEERGPTCECRCGLGCAAIPLVWTSHNP